MDETLKLRLRVEDLLFEEADLLDQWKLNDWLALYTEDAHYHVPPSDVDGDTATPESALFYIMDDSVRMRERVVRLSKIGAPCAWMTCSSCASASPAAFCVFIAHPHHHSLPLPPLLETHITG